MKVMLRTLPVIFLVVGCTYMTMQLQWEKLNQQVEHLYNQGKYSEAIPIALKALEKAEAAFGPCDYRVAISLYNLGLLYYSQNEYPRAEALFRRALHIYEKLRVSDSAIVGLLRSLEYTYIAQGKYSEAEDLLKRIIKTHRLAKDEKAKDMVELGIVYYYKRRYSKAEEYFKQSLDIRRWILPSDHPDLIESLYWLGLVYKAKKDYDKAETFLKKALKKAEKVYGSECSEVAALNYYLAEVYMVKNKYSEAEILLEKALDVYEKLNVRDSEMVNLLRNLALVYNAQGKRHKANIFLNRFVRAKRIKKRQREHPEEKSKAKMILTDNLSPNEIYELGAQLFRDQEFYDAQQYFQQAFERAEEETLKVKALYMLARCAKGRYDYEKAMYYYNMIVQDFPSSRLADDALFQMAYLEPDIDKSILLYEKLIQTYPASEHIPGAMLRLGRNLYIQEKADYLKGRKLLKKLADRFPEYKAQALYWIGDSYCKEGLLDSAYSFFKSLPLPSLKKKGLLEVVDKAISKAHDWGFALLVSKEIERTFTQDELPYWGKELIQAVKLQMETIEERVKALEYELKLSENSEEKYKKVSKMAEIYDVLGNSEKVVAMLRKAIRWAPSSEQKRQKMLSLANYLLYNLVEIDSAYAVYKELYQSKDFKTRSRAAKGMLECLSLKNEREGLKQLLKEFQRSSKKFTFHPIKVEKGSNLYRISSIYYGCPLYWRILYRDNQKGISHPDTVHEGQCIYVRSSQEGLYIDETLAHFIHGDNLILHDHFTEGILEYLQGLQKLLKGFSNDASLKNYISWCKECQGKINSPEKAYQLCRLVYRTAYFDKTRIYCLRWALDKFPSSPLNDKVLYTLGIIYKRLGVMKEATTCFEQLMKRFPTSPLTDDAIYYLVQNKYAARNDHAQAAFLLEGIYDNFGIKSDFALKGLWEAALHYECAGQIDNAVRCYKKIAEEENVQLSSRIEALYILGCLNKYKIHNHELARSYFNKILDIVGSSSELGLEALIYNIMVREELKYISR